MGTRECPATHLRQIAAAAAVAAGLEVSMGLALNLSSQIVRKKRIGGDSDQVVDHLICPRRVGCSWPKVPNLELFSESPFERRSSSSGRRARKKKRDRRRGRSSSS